MVLDMVNKNMAIEINGASIDKGIDSVAIDIHPKSVAI